MAVAEIHMREIMAQMTVKVSLRGVRQFGMRLWIGKWFMLFGSKIIGYGLKFDEPES